ncbi:MAG TPA: A/G-specific adenine glycosylase, partial [Hyphomicrobiaceae bacterium]|nr:A/G-specific adenine glycosylase [Hyphomicrobiaceae bacterium]
MGETGVAKRERGPTAAPEEASNAVLAWYDLARRDLPWRAQPGRGADPYGVWLSEIM